MVIELFTASFVLLCALVLLEALIIQRVLRDTLTIRSVKSAQSRRSGDSLGYGLPEQLAVPSFSAPLLRTGMMLSASDLLGKKSILVFVRPSEASPAYETIGAAIHAWYHQVSGNVYLVCSGEREECQRFSSDISTNRLGGKTLETVYDDGAEIARGFGVNAAPLAVELNEEVRIVRVGHPDYDNGASEASFDMGYGFRRDVALPDSGAFDSDPHMDDSASIHGLLHQQEDAVSADGEALPNRPENCSHTNAGYARVTSSVSCLLTRFRLRSALSLIPFYFAFRRVRAQARDIEGLLQACFLVESPRTCYTMSFWANESAILEFGSRVKEHVTAANSAFRPTYNADNRRCEIWSAQFRLWAVSDHNLVWNGLDLDRLIHDEWSMRGADSIRSSKQREH